MSNPKKQSGSLHLGVPSCDLEHEELKLRTRHLEDALLRSASPAEVQGHMDAVLEGALAHFEHEETLMAQAAYPHLESHRHAHDRLLRTLMHFKEDLRRQRYRPEVAVRFIRAWDEEHIQKVDVDYVPYITESGEQKS